jgi:uncharacterized protein (TIGR00266 family)
MTSDDGGAVFGKGNPFSPGSGSFLGGTGIFGSVPQAASAYEYQRRPGVADDVDFEIKGHEMQFVEIELDPGESCIAEAGVMMFKDAAIGMETVFGDGGGDGGLLGKLWRGAKRVLSGTSLFMTQFTHNGQGKARVAFAAPYPGKIIPLRLDQLGGEILCQRDSFLAGARGVTIDVGFQKKIMTGLFGGEGFVMQKLTGDGWVFAHAGGTVVERELAPGEELHVDSGCLVAQTPSISFDVVPVGGVKSMLFGGEGFFFARLVGPGHVWMQSLPFSRLVGTILARAPARAGVGVGAGFSGGGHGGYDAGSGDSWDAGSNSDSGDSGAGD